MPHRLYGVVAASEAFSVGRWLEQAQAAIGEAVDEGRVPILVGGTGLYFKALLEGLAPIPDIPEMLRELLARSSWSGSGPRRFIASLRRAIPGWRRSSGRATRNASCVRSK